MLSLPRTLIMTAAATAALLVVPAQAGAAPAPSPEVLSQGLAGPLQIDIGSEGQIYVAQSFAGILTKVRPNGTTKDLTTYAGEIAGVASRGYDVAFTTTNGGETAPTTAAYLKVRFSNGTVRNIVNLFTFESKHNPDARNTYGFKNLTAACTAELAPLVDVIGPPTYSGLVDSHPYAIANAPDGGWYIAEAAGNTILKVSREGRVSVVSVLAPVPVVITAEAAAANGLPACTIGATYRFEAVPTDVEVGPGGMLYVSSLPGGPEDGSLGALGRVLRIDPVTGATKVVGRGFLGATNVAVTPKGRVFVAELFGNRISTIKDGWAKPVVDVPTPAGVEYAAGSLYASIDVFGNGTIVRIPL